MLNLEYFSKNNDKDGSIGNFILKSLVASNIESIIDLDLSANSSWFKHADIGEDLSGPVDEEEKK